ncbi:MAG: thiamine diphosphokinase [Clostridia bacterium]|nr:thiamine diphosphokinase [Clostridia bacterium]
MKVAIFLNNKIMCCRNIVADKVICADGGFNVCNMRPDIIIGDCDSIINKPENAEYKVFEKRKNDTDGTLSIKCAVEDLHADEIVIYGVTGGRFDHALGNLTLLKLAASYGVKCKAEDNDLDIYFADKNLSFNAKIGDTISIIPYCESATVKYSKGLEYPLENLTLTNADTRGISNVASDETVSISVSNGSVFVFHNL